MIYLDNAATTKLKKSALKAMLPCFDENYANPSAIYLAAGKARRIVEEARESLAEELHCDRDEVYFTSGGTESDNWAVFGTAEAYSVKGKHLITQKTEHHAVLNAFKVLEKKGWEITLLDVDENGILDPDEVERALRKDTVLVSVMTANNETGVLQKIGEIGKITRRNGTIFHTDAVQAFGHTDIDVKALNIDLLSASSHKLGGPKGTGLLYMNRDCEIGPLIYGGGQERGMRSGTENVPGIAGFAAAVKDRDDQNRVKALRDHLKNRIIKENRSIIINGDTDEKLSGILNISVSGVKGESLLMRFSSLGICVSTGSACTSRSFEPSHVLTAMGADRERCDSSVRFSLCGDNTLAEMDRVADAFKDIVDDFRNMICR